jgi:hypothetical protein
LLLLILISEYSLQFTSSSFRHSSFLWFKSPADLLLLSRILVDYPDILGESDVKGSNSRISGAEMASVGNSIGLSRGEEMTKGMMQIVELMFETRDREALIDKAVDRTVQITGRFDGKNITKFLATYRNEMQQRDVQD